MLCAYMQPRYQVSVYMTNGPLVLGTHNLEKPDILSTYRY